MKTGRRGEYAEFAALMFIQAGGMAAWFVPLGTVLDAHGLGAIKPYAFAASAVAAFISPLFFGAMTDRHLSPVKVLRGLALTTAATMALTGFAIEHQWNLWLVLAVIQAQSLCMAPTWCIASTVVFARLKNAGQEFGPIRAMGTLGWVVGCLLVSGLNADSSALAGYSGAVIWLVVASFTLILPPMEAPATDINLSWQERLGLDALTLFKNSQHRVIFITTALLNVSIAAFYPYAPTHLHDLGFQHTAAWMSLGQSTEVVAMFALGGLLLWWPFKWVLATGLIFGMLRFVFSAGNTPGWLLLGIALHGASYALVITLGQIYLETNVEAAWRARAQALYAVMTGGVGNLLGYLGSDWWFHLCTTPAGTHWPRFWHGLAASVGAALIYFLICFRPRNKLIAPAARGL